MASPTRRAFTKIEAVVLAVVLGSLLLLVPSCLVGVRTPTRKSQCANNQKQLALASLNSEAVNGQFPGYVNRLGQNDGSPLEASWVVMLFPYLERTKLWEAWNNDNPARIYIKILVCPSDPPKDVVKSDTPLSYVVNCGRPGDGDTQADGVFFNHAVDGEPVKTSIDYISKHDGVTNTLMLSENIQAGYWTDTGEADLGMVWWDEPETSNRMNQCIDVGDRPQDIRYARPSSHHGNGAIVAYCDGHVRFLRADIDYRIYKQLMSPDDGGPKESEYD